MRPTMSHAVNKEQFKDLLIEYLEKRNSELEEMLDTAWDAVTEAGCQGYSNELKRFMEED